MNSKRLRIWLIMVFILVSTCIVGSIVASASDTDAEDAMYAIEAELSEYKIGNTVSVAKDGYIGIPVEVSVYHGGGSVVTGNGVDATPIVVYVVNTRAQRIGTDSDVDIISSMIERGYAVVIFDYLNNYRAISPDLDWSVQALRANVTNGTYLKGVGMPSGTYNNNMVVPAGYNIEFGHVYWEIDKHAADGTLERIVEVWNNDFRAKKKNVLIKWVDENGNRKAVQNGHDGSAPVWLDAGGNASSDGEYVLVKHTKAEKIEDCVKKDGTPIDLSLRMHIVYPTSVAEDVPVMVLSGSSGHLAGGTQTADRPHLNGFLFNGYAGATFEHGWVPMARDDHYGYFDGDDNDSITGDNATYSIHNFNDTRIDTAAVRYLRYLSASEHTKYTFDSNAIGVYGNSKGGWATMLGEAEPDINFSRRIYAGYNGKSRYDNGKTEDIVFGSYVIDGGEEQPWLEYNGVKLANGANLTYMSCGWGPYCITSAHSPTFISCNTGDGSYTGVSNQYVNACRNADVVTMWFEVDQGHTFASEKDLRYGVNTYQAFLDFSGYHLKGDAVKVVYVSRAADSYSGMPTNAPITVKFTGPVSADEIAKITVIDSKGNAVSGTWTAQYGNTEWTLATPTLGCDEEYTVTVPAGIKGDNGREMAQAYTHTFRTGKEKATDVSALNTSKGTYLYFTVPEISDITEFNVDLYTLRLYVSNDAVNKLNIYALKSFDANAPDNASVGSLIKTVPVAGAGQYDVDIASYVSGVKAGTTVAFLVKQASAACEVAVHSSPLVSSLGGCTKGGKVSTTLTNAPDGTKALKIYNFSSSTSYTNDKFYQNFATLFTNSSVIKTDNLVESDIGRTFRISFKIYDTTSRIISVQMASLSNYSALFADYNVSFYNVYTKANEWVEVSFEHTVYEPLYASEVGYKAQKLTVYAPLEGSEMSEIYVSDVNSVEIFTDVTLDRAELLLGTTEQRKNPLATEYGTIPTTYADADEYPFVIFDEKGNCIGAHKNFLDTTSTYNNGGALHMAKSHLATANYWDGESYGSSPSSVVIIMRKDYTMTDDERYDNIAQIQGLLTLDLGGNTLTAAKSRTIFPATSKQWSGSGDANYFHTTEFKFYNGTIVTYDEPIVSFNCTAAEPKRFDIYFENVELRALGTATSFVLDYSTTSSTKASTPDISFDNCTFDISGSKASDRVVLFNLGKLVINASFSVTGGTVIAGDTAFDVHSYGSEGTLAFFKDNDGNYLQLITDGAAAPEGTFNRGKLEFMQTGAYAQTAVYTLAPTGLKSFVPSMSISLASDLLANVYVPVTGLIRFELDGVRYTNLSVLEPTELDGVSYYRISIPLRAYEAAREIELSAKLSFSGTSVTRDYIFTVPEYAAKIIASDATEIEKTLAYDVLAYIRAAYTYFGTGTTPEIDALLEGYDPAFAADGSAAASVEGLAGATFALDSTPEIWFTLPDGADVSAYTFMQGNTALEHTVAQAIINGKTCTVIKIRIDAYRMCDGITYSINGVVAGAYSIGAYYEFAKADGELKPMVEAFWQYCRSAKAYMLELQG